MWGQICWVRLLRARGRFEGASSVLERVLPQIDQIRAPRLFRNAMSAKELIEERVDSQLGLNYPVGTTKYMSPDLNSITRKPMLNSLFKFLANAGVDGATKEDIALKVWEESYNPLIHDDRIYKAVGRLRKLLNDKTETPELLIQTGRKYVLNFPMKGSEL